MKSILDPSFCYTSSTNTDVRKTFDRVRRELREAAIASVRNQRTSNVLALARDSTDFTTVSGAGALKHSRLS
jgi:hypothetical protein